jgi:hypothetical protein
MSEQNPYDSPQVDASGDESTQTPQKKKSNAPLIIGLTAGAVLMATFALAGGMAFVGLLGLLIILFIGKAVSETLFGQSPANSRRAIKARLEKEAKMRRQGKPGAVEDEEPEIPPDDFLRQLQNE